MKVAVIGAGVAGLSTAARLSLQNIDVDLYESSSQVGGKMYQYTNLEGLSWDTGPTLISLPDEIRRTFKEINHTCPTLLPLKESCHLYFQNNTILKIPAGKQNVIEYFYKKEAELGKNIEHILSIAEQIYDFAEKELFYQCPPSLFQLGIKALKSKFLLSNTKLTLNSYENLVRSLISDENLREFFYHFSSYIGTIPKYAQAGILSIAHIELGLEIVFPKGGVYSVAKSLEEACRKYKTNILLNHQVLDAKLSKHKNKWLISSRSHDQLMTKEYDSIISNCDPYVASTSWLKEEKFKQSFTPQLKSQKYRPSESQFVILYDWQDSSVLSHHTKIFPKSWKKSFEDVWLHYQIPEDPCIYLVWPHATDPSISPRILFISAMAPNTLSSYRWDETFCTQYANKILNICRDRLKIDLKGKIFKTVTPLELEQRAKGLCGGIYSAAYNGFNPTQFNFSGKTSLKNLYFVGSAVHPGAGVTMVMKSARRISNIILNT